MRYSFKVEGLDVRRLLLLRSTFPRPDICPDICPDIRPDIRPPIHPDIVVVFWTDSSGFKQIAFAPDPAKYCTIAQLSCIESCSRNTIVVAAGPNGLAVEMEMFLLLFVAAVGGLTTILRTTTQ